MKLRHYLPLIVLALFIALTLLSLAHAELVGRIVGTADVARVKSVLESLLVSIVTAAVIYVAFDAFLQTQMVDEFKRALLDPKALESFISDDNVISVGLASLRRLYQRDRTKDFAEGVWRLVMHMRETSPEFVTDVSYECELADENEDYYRINMTLSYYRLTFRDGSLVVCCRVPDLANNSAEQIINSTDGCEFSWALLPHSSNYKLKKGDFLIKRVRVGNATIFRREDVAADFRDDPNEKGEIRWEFPRVEWERHVRNAREGTLIEVELSALQAKRYGFWSSGCRFPCKRFMAQLDFSGCGRIDEVYIVPHFVSEERSRVTHPAKKRAKVMCDGWLLPYSGAVFSWMERSNPRIPIAAQPAVEPADPAAGASGVTSKDRPGGGLAAERQSVGRANDDIG